MSLPPPDVSCLPLVSFSVAFFVLTHVLCDLHQEEEMHTKSLEEGVRGAADAGAKYDMRYVRKEKLRKEEHLGCSLFLLLTSVTQLFFPPSSSSVSSWDSFLPRVLFFRDVSCACADITCAEVLNIVLYVILSHFLSPVQVSWKPSRKFLWQQLLQVLSSLGFGWRRNLFFFPSNTLLTRKIFSRIPFPVTRT